MELNNDFHLAVCQSIESGLRAEYDETHELTDALCVLGLDNSIIAVKQKFGFAKNEAVRSHLAIDGIVAHVVKLGFDNIGKAGHLTLRDYVAIINKVKKSVVRHSAFGSRGYYDFIRNYV
ncbi:MAG: hypothetical protein JWR56_2737 [Massilia sp.]|nr:hypothetical protein [Massilia sp.]